MHNIDFGTDNFRGYSTDFTSAQQIFAAPLIRRSVKDGQKLTIAEFQGKLIKPLDELHALIAEHGGKLWLNQKDDGSVFIFGDEGFVSLRSEKSKDDFYGEAIYIGDMLDELTMLIEKDFISKEISSTIFAVVNSPEGLSYERIGNVTEPLVRENYSKELIREYDRVIASLKRSSSGDGRIVLMQGSYGVGKTYIVRGMIADLDFVCLLVPASLVSELDGPSFLPMLLNVKHEKKDKPILIIVEDGDSCLVSRGNDNMSAISSLLNISDGILGTVLDIKIVVTTNADVGEIDKAILRPGRLCSQMFVDPLSYELSCKIARRIANSWEFTLPEKREYVLAELYALVNNKEFFKVGISESKRIGF